MISRSAIRLRIPFITQDLAIEYAAKPFLPSAVSHFPLSKVPAVRMNAESISEVEAKEQDVARLGVEVV
jgi:hypothetical protein